MCSRGQLLPNTQRSEMRGVGGTDDGVVKCRLHHLQQLGSGHSLQAAVHYQLLQWAPPLTCHSSGWAMKAARSWAPCEGGEGTRETGGQQ